MATTTATKSLTADYITRFYSMLIPEAANAAWITNEAARVDSGVTTLGQVVRTLMQSPSFTQNHVIDLARMFFLTFDRAPDATYFKMGMDSLREGYTIDQVAEAALRFPGNPLSNDGLPDHATFVTTLAGRVFGPGADPGTIAYYTEQLNAGTMTRGQLLALASTLPTLNVMPAGGEIAGLAFLAGANREITKAETTFLQGGSLDARIIQALAAAGLSATGDKPALYNDPTTGTMTLFSELKEDLRWDTPAKLYTLKGASKFDVFYSTDLGLSGSIITFDPAMANGTTTLDASRMTGKGKITYIGPATQNTVFKAPLGGSDATGGTGNDVFIGNSGKDTFYITAGKDILTGGAGDDTFVLPNSQIYLTGTVDTNTTTITDFGVGADILDFTRLLNLKRNIDITTLSAIRATTAVGTLTALNGSITLIDNNGLWTTGSGSTLAATKPNASQVAALFGTPTATGKSVVITADTVVTADVWLIYNASEPGRITDGTSGAGGTNGPLEVFKVAEIVGSWNPSLVGFSPVPKDAINPV